MSVIVEKGATKIPLGIGERTLTLAELIILVVAVILAWKKPFDYWEWVIIALVALGFIIW